MEDKVPLNIVFFRHKLIPNFQETVFEDVGKNNNIIQLLSGGRTLTINVSYVRKIPISASELFFRQHSAQDNNNTGGP